MEPQTRPVFIEVHGGRGGGWLDETATVESGNSTAERTNLGLRVGALWAVSVGVYSRVVLQVARMNATNSGGGGSQGDVCRGTVENFSVVRSWAGG